jgi:hypothetical protein
LRLIEPPARTINALSAEPRTENPEASGAAPAAAWVTTRMFMRAIVRRRAAELEAVDGIT